MQPLATPAPQPVITPADEQVPFPLVTPAAPAPAPLPLPPSGFRQAARTTGRALGYLTSPVWWPLAKWTQEMGRGAQEVLGTPRALKIQALAHLTKIRTDASLWESWTPEQRRSVVRQQAVWTSFLVLASLVTPFIPVPWNLLPLLGASIAWWIRGHNLPGLDWRWDVVRWALRLPQIQELPRPVPQEDPGV